MNTRRWMARTFIMALLLAAAPAAADDDEAARRRRELDRAMESDYPSFVGGTAPEQTPPPPTPTPDPTPEAESTDDDTLGAPPVAMPVSPQQPTIPEVLAIDVTSTATWLSVRDRLDPRLEQLRILLITGATPEELGAEADAFATDLAVLADSAPYQAPNQVDSLTDRTRLMTKYLAVLTRSYDPANPSGVATTLSLLERTLGEAQLLIDISDEERGAGAAQWRVPPDWHPGRFADPDFASRIATMPAQTLLNEYRLRNKAILRELRRPPKEWDLHAAIEMGELARELARRAHEVPNASRPGFRNAALRLDVLAQSLHDYMHAHNLLYARRHQRITEWATRDCQAFLNVRYR